MARPLRTLLLVLAWTLFFSGVALLGTRVLRDARVDVTQAKVHTPSPAALRIARGLDRPIRLTLFYSSGTGSKLPEVVAHAERVRSLLRRLERASGGRLVVDEVDPEPFSEAEERAANAGVAQVRTGDGTLYFGLAGSNDVDGAQGIAYLDPALAPRLEYDVARVLLLLNETERPRVGVYSPVLPLDGEVISLRMQGRPWAVYNELRRVYDVVEIDAEAQTLPEDLDALLIVHPKDVPESLLASIDGAVIDGLPVVVIVDPNCETDVPAEAQDDPRMLASYDISSDLPALFSAWGIAYDREKVVTDRATARTVQVARGNETVALDYIAYLRLGREQMAKGVRALERIESLNIASAGALDPAPGASTTFTPLVTTSDDAMLIQASNIRFSPDPQRLLRAYAPSGRAFTIGASVEGEARSAFGDHAGEIRATVIADADMFSDRQWVEPRRVGGQVVGAVRSADNAELLIGVLAEYVASDALLSIAPREGQVRAFERVQEMRREAQQAFAAEEQRLSDELAEAERRLSELGGAVGSVEQRAELERVRSVRADIRRRLRDIRFELDREIEALGDRVKLLNIVVVPVLVAVAALVVGFVRRAGRAAERRAQRGGAS